MKAIIASERALIGQVERLDLSKVDVVWLAVFMASAFVVFCFFPGIWGVSMEIEVEAAFAVLSFDVGECTATPGT